MNAKNKRSNPSKNNTDYNNFVGQIEIIDICLISAKIDNLVYAKSHPEIEFSIRERAWYENQDCHIDAFHRYSLTAKDADNKHNIAKVSVTFVVKYESKIPMTEEIFRAFKERNLPLNTWPYFREFVQNTFMRMGWTAVVVPVYNVVVSRSKVK
jgi:hypothetical protein